VLYIFLVFAAIVACNVVDVDENLSRLGKVSVSGMITEIISGRQVATKATINDETAAFAWTVGDNIAVHVSNGTTNKYVSTADKGASGASVAAASAQFTVIYEADYSRDCFAIYPSTLVSTVAASDSYGQDADHPLVVTLPSSYTLTQVSGTTSPCPMISTNESTSDGWDFYQLCSLLRLTVSEIPTTAKRLEIDFNGKKVCGEFSIALPVMPGTSVIATSDDHANGVITITKNGENVTLDETSLDLNIPLPTGNYNKITVIAYDALTGGKALKGWTVAFNYTAQNKYATKKEATECSLQSTFNFTFKNGDTELSNVRFARVFSVKNALHNTSDYGPYTKSANENLTSPINATLYFDKASNDQLVFQVVTGDGKVYSGSVDAPSDGYNIGETYNITANVNLYTFTMRSGNSGNKFYFSPGDLGVDNGVYSFTEPFTTWDHGNIIQYADDAILPAKRVWFDIRFDGGVVTGGTVYGITDWRSPIRAGSGVETYEWNYLVDSRTMNSGVSRYYKVTIPGHQYCLLLPPDETLSSDIGEDLTTGEVTDYAKYLGKGFVLLFNTNRGLYGNGSWSWGSETDTYQHAKVGFYWAKHDNSQRYYFAWQKNTSTSVFVPKVYWGANQMRNHIRYVRNVE